MLDGGAYSRLGEERGRRVGAVQPHGQKDVSTDVRGAQEAGANKIQTLLPGANKILLPGGRSEQTLLPRANKIQILMPEDVIGEIVLLVHDGG